MAGGSRIRGTELYLSWIVWYSFMERSSGCGFSTVGSGFPGWIDVGNSCRSSIAAGSGAGVVAGVCLSGGVTVRFFEACSFLAAALAGSFLFLSIFADSPTGGVVACAAACYRGTLWSKCDYSDRMYGRSTMIMMVVRKKG